MPETKRTATGVLGGVLGLVSLSAIAGVLVTAAVTPAIAVSGAAASSAITMFDNLPSSLKIDSLMLPTTIYSKNSDGSDHLLAEFYDQNRIPVTYDQVAPVMIDAMLSSEDKNFFEHGGVDLVGTLNAVAGNITGAHTRGGSTITQQYVKNVLQQNCEKAAVSLEEVEECFEDTTVSEGSEGIQRKLQEMRYAIALEQRYDKTEVLLGYLNIAHFGGSTYGIGAAAQYYFSTDAASLTLGQAAALAGMVQEPNGFRIDRPDDEDNGEANGYARTKERQVYVLDRMLADDKITQEQHDEAVNEPIAPALSPRPQGCQQAAGAEFFCDYVRTLVENDPVFGADEEERAAALRRGGLKIYTTLDADLQAVANDAIHIVPPTHPDVDLGASAIQLEVGTGRVLSMVQNRYYSQDRDLLAADGNYTAVNYNTRAANGSSIGHPAGSTYKIFTLLNWLEQGNSVNEVLDGRTRNYRVLTQCDGSSETKHAGGLGGPSSVGNFEANPGYVGTPARFTADSLNSGFFAMSERVSVCSTNQLAMKLGVMQGNGAPLDESNQPFDVLGSQPVAPIDMAAVYAAVANRGTLCEPRAIDRIVDAEGNEIAPPGKPCAPAISEGVAATAAYALERVMDGTGVGARIYDGVPVIGKTGIHENLHTWMDGASTEVATVVWVGNVEGSVDIHDIWWGDERLSRIRNSIWPVMQGAANDKFGGEAFPTPDSNLTRNVLTDLPSVIGMTVEEAESTLRDAGFNPIVAEPVEGPAPAGLIVSQEPGAGMAPANSTITIAPSNGEGATVPEGLVGSAVPQAQSALQGAGFGNVVAVCEKDDDAPKNGRVTAVDPGEGTAANRSTQITVTYERQTCP